MLEYSRFFNTWKWPAGASIFLIEEKDKLPIQEPQKKKKKNLSFRLTPYQQEQKN